MKKGYSKKDEKVRRYLGTFTLPSEVTAVGQLELSGSDTRLTLHPNELSGKAWSEGFIHGTAYSGECLTLLGCQNLGATRTRQSDGTVGLSLDVFPHHVLAGRTHIAPTQRCICSIQFTTNDIRALVHDTDSFGSVHDSKAAIELLQTQGLMDKLETGDWPKVLFYSGKDTIAEAETAIGKVSIHHHPSSGMSISGGVRFKNHIVASIEFDAPLCFHDAMGRMCVLATFLSVAAGRGQKMKAVSVEVSGGTGNQVELLEVISSMRWKTTSARKSSAPEPFDVPLDPVRRRAEFEAVLENWREKHEGRGLARSRYLDCIQKGYYYDVDRLVAAANMFDLLPEEAIPLSTEMSPELAETVAKCRAMFREHPAGIDRNSVLNSLGRIGKPSLPKKVLHRASIVEQRMGDRFPQLSFVATIAVKCRNVFVHGGDADIDIERLNPLTPFLAAALEFIFAASDLIDSGWDCKTWASNPHGFGHAFARFSWDYREHLIELQAVLA